MNRESRKIKSFTDLVAWQEGHKLVITIYKLTNKYPKEEIFGLTNQIRRASVSITSNIAEGFGRSSYKEKHQYYSMALGSLSEVQNQLLVSKDVGYLNKEFFDEVAQQSIIVSKLLNGLKKGAKRMIHNS